MPTAAPSEDLASLLHQVFGHRGFRAHQREVCEAAAAGRDVLLVMPTGAGKSLCYQLPALARIRAGSESDNAANRPTAALVISPLIALMDDQAQKLAALGLRVARVHSGLSREDARQACHDYLTGALDFLFIAPERMRVPGFPEMLAKRNPALVAIDEAHCISAWGHDFRPDYRTLGERLRTLWPATGAMQSRVPIMALTATATPAVQRDILEQLHLRAPAVFITGFRRENLAVQAVELSKPRRAEFTAEFLKDKAARPAIVYAASRKAAEELATKLNANFPARAYHAGMESNVRERVQRDFLTGKIDVVVATVAFGMGVDKPDVRSVVHVALPGSVEAFYQEIGRAGRDGLPSRTVLLYNFGDRKTQEFFLEKNYPAASELERVARTLGGLPQGEFVSVEDLQRRLGKDRIAMDRETLDRSIEKLIAVGVAEIGTNGDVRATGTEASRSSAAAWKASYETQVAARRSQIDRMVAFAEGHTCRMTALVQHFGDRTDDRGPCGLCDVCRPESCAGDDGAASAAHPPDAREQEKLRAILKAIASRGQSTGKLFSDLQLCKERSDFDALLDGLARARLLTLESDTFRTPEGRDVTYRKAVITHEGRTPDDATLATVRLRGGASSSAAKTGGKKSRRDAAIANASLSPAAAKLFDHLRAWRTEQARPNATPAFLILTDAVLRAIATAAPQNLAELSGVPGLGTSKSDRYGADVLAVCRGEAAAVKVACQQDVSQRGQARVQKSSLRAASADRTGSEQETGRVAPRTAWTGLAARQQERPTAPTSSISEMSAAQGKIEGRLKQWRREEAQKSGLPSFFVFSDTVLREIVLAQPSSLAELREVRGVGAEKLERFGAAVVKIVEG
jgi:ATP-dependent DNA helicase RecQ